MSAENPNCRVATLLPKSDSKFEWDVYWKTYDSKSTAAGPLDVYLDELKLGKQSLQQVADVSPNDMWDKDILRVSVQPWAHRNLRLVIETDYTDFEAKLKQGSRSGKVGPTVYTIRDGNNKILSGFADSDAALQTGDSCAEVWKYGDNALFIYNSGDVRSLVSLRLK